MGEQVCIMSGSMRGIRGTPMHKGDGLRFAVSFDLINQQAR
jgi:hypothetical protein